MENEEQVAADTVLFGTGVSPRTELAERAGLAVEGRNHHRLRNAYQRNGVFAVGDVAQAYNESAGRHLSVEHWGRPRTRSYRGHSARRR